MSSVYRAKPRSGDFEIEYRPAIGWFVISPDGRRSDNSFANRNAALSAKGHAVRRAADLSKGKMRPCITCRKDFLSEGAHHRMCGQCRHNSPGEASQTPYISQAARRR